MDQRPDVSRLLVVDGEATAEEVLLAEDEAVARSVVDEEDGTEDEAMIEDAVDEAAVVATALVDAGTEVATAEEAPAVRVVSVPSNGQVITSLVLVMVVVSSV